MTEILNEQDAFPLLLGAYERNYINAIDQAFRMGHANVWDIERGVINSDGRIYEDIRGEYTYRLAAEERILRPMQARAQADIGDLMRQRSVREGIAIENRLQQLFAAKDMARVDNICSYLKTQGNPEVVARAITRADALGHNNVSDRLKGLGMSMDSKASQSPMNM